MTSALLTNSDGLTPSSLAEAAGNVYARISTMQDDFEARMLATVDAQASLLGAEKRTMQIITDANTLGDRARALMIDTWKQDATQVDQRRHERTRSRERHLANNDWSVVAEFYRKSAKLLESQAGDAMGITETEWKAQARTFIQAEPNGTYLLEHFGDEIMTLLSTPETEKHDDFRLRVFDYAASDTTLSPEDRADIQTKLLGILEAIAEFAMEKQNILSFSGNAVNGLLGSVLDPADMQRVVDRNYDPIEQLAPGSIRLVIGGDREVSFYHKKEDEKIPNGILPEGKAEEIPHVVFVHSVTDTDVKKLFADMSAGQVVSAKLRGRSETIEIQGISGDPDFNVMNLPAGIEEVDLKANPMKYLDHHFNVTIPTKKA